MPAASLNVSWPGIKGGIQSCTYTVSHGTAPGIAHLTCSPQANLPDRFGNLVMGDGRQRIVIPQCKIDRIEETRDSNGVHWHLIIMDRRWQWRDPAGGAIRGVWNQPDPHGILLPWTVKKVKELVQLCLDALIEPGAVVRVPELTYPPVNWDYIPPAQALAQLVEPMGCRICYRLDSDTVLIMPLGEGEPLPDGSISSEAPSFDDPERPDKIVLVGDYVRFQGRFLMQAVGKDWDGLYRPLDALSYKPANGWPTCASPTFPGIEATDRLTKLQAIALAQESVYKCYQIVNAEPIMLAAGAGKPKPLQIPGVGALVRRQQIVLENEKVEQIQPAAPDERFFDADGDKLIKHFYNGFRRGVPAECYGSCYFGKGTARRNLDPDKKIPIPFTIDPEHQLITFSDYVCRVYATDTKKQYPAVPILETGFMLRDADTNQIIRYEREYVFPDKSGVPPLYVNHDDVAYNVVSEYDTSKAWVLADAGSEAATKTDHVFKGVKNLSGFGFPIEETILRSTHYLKGHAARFKTSGGNTRTYNGLMPIWLDGRVQQVTWTLDINSGIFTQASENTEHANYIPPFPQRLKIEYQPAIMKPPQPKEAAGRDVLGRVPMVFK